MAGIWWISLAVVAVVAVVVTAAVAAYWWRPRLCITPAARFTRAKRRFHTERERLEAKFIQLAAARGKLDAPRWSDCSFADDVAYVRNRTSGELSAFVAVTIATEGYGRSSRATDNVGNLQAGTAVFRLDRDHWVTDGRAILNLTPAEAVHYYRNDLEMVDEEFAHRV